MLLGCIADDLTGATDLALMLTREGMRTIQSIGVPGPDLDVSEIDALIVALKSRSIPSADAIAVSLEAARSLRALGARHLFFKYCSTFDSTDAGNIGPVADALLDFVGGDRTIACPAFPRAGRTVYTGHLFVGDALLSESPMKDHPLTPMRDPDLRRVLGRQTGRPIGLIAFDDVDAGPDSIVAALDREAEAGRAIAIVDALTDRHLHDIGMATASLPLLTGGSGVAIGLPAAYRAAGDLAARGAPPNIMAAPPGRSAILAGSCSAMTRRQVATAIAAGLPALAIDPDGLINGRQTADTVLDWLDWQRTDRPALVYSTAEPDAVRRMQALHGRDAAGALVEHVLAETARGLTARGVTRLIVAGGETSGAVVQALGVRALTIGPEICPGVPWTRTTGTPDLALALKSGNFGDPDFFLKAWDMLT